MYVPSQGNLPRLLVLVVEVVAEEEVVVVVEVVAVDVVVVVHKLGEFTQGN